ncbi:Nacht and wd40 domain protein, partial [Apiospora aurea]
FCTTTRHDGAEKERGLHHHHANTRVIELNPLVTGFKPIKAPRDAPSDEFYSTWYEITERIQYIPGLGRLGSGSISFNGCFHDMPWGLQSHIYVGSPANVDLRNKYRIAGNQPGVEPPEPQEMGLASLGAPKDGLYLHEDIEIRCNFAMVGFVKTQLKAASKEMVNRFIKKAELLDAGVLSAMIEDGKLRTVNPNDRSTQYANAGSGSGPNSPPARVAGHPLPSSTTDPQQYSRPGTAGSQAPGYYVANHNRYSELPNPTAPPAVVMELPGDYHYPQPSPGSKPGQPSPGLAISEQSVLSSPDPNSNWRWSQSQPSPGLQQSRPTSMSSEGGGSVGVASPGLDHKGFTNELSTHSETREEHTPEPLRVKHPSHYPYNPADYAKVGYGDR